MEQKQTIAEWLEGLANSNQSTERDSTIMEGVLRTRLGFPKARVVIGVVYLEGYGPPIDIHSLARMILKNRAEAEAHV